LYRYEVHVLPHPLPKDHKFAAPTLWDDAYLALAPGASVSTTFARKQPLTTQELTDIQADRARIYVWGEATYVDAFEVSRRIEVDASVVGGTFFVQYITAYCTTMGTGSPPQLPPGMQHAFQFDYHSRHGHGD
jgi:hypothetical protein